ncbi:hypothetical protein GGU10DRAFT_340817 [Lentinula aff. detonsa]|uniref:Uncharacterized protein n=1 Tax=Lentinula aff. detonsa TaxID=2804958 RepID=A0AA38NSR5_9AGAR|nr:hypothetical protein GGU10DRAFT_340817 [Lentinula aff. detonsa]
MLAWSGTCFNLNVVTLFVFVLGIMVLSGIPATYRHQKDDEGENSASCGLTITTGSVSFLLSLSSTSAAFHVYHWAWSNGGIMNSALAIGADGANTRNKTAHSSRLDMRITCYSPNFVFAVSTDLLGPMDVQLNSQRYFHPLLHTPVQLRSSLGSGSLYCAVLYPPATLIVRERS